jgi:uncharacterized protein with HEPN domain
MPRNALAYLSDVVEACDAIAVTLRGVDLPTYEATRTLRSAVEREFTIIGEADRRRYAARLSGKAVRPHSLPVRHKRRER